MTGSESIPNFFMANARSSSEVPGACPPNWLQLNAMTCKPSLPYRSVNIRSPCERSWPCLGTPLVPQKKNTKVK